MTTAAARRHALLQARAAVDLGESGPAAAALQAYVDLQGLAAGAAHYERALLLDDLGRAADALNAADRALANTMLPRATRLDALLLAARSLESDGEWERARDRYREFADASPWWGDDAVALSRIASLSLELGEIDTAIEAWRTLVADFAEHPEALTALAGLMGAGRRARFADGGAGLLPSRAGRGRAARIHPGADRSARRSGGRGGGVLHRADPRPRGRFRQRPAGLQRSRGPRLERRRRDRRCGRSLGGGGALADGAD